MTFARSWSVGRTSEPKRRQSIVQPQFLDDLRYFIETDHKRAGRLLRLMEEAIRTPFEGTGKPEALKGKEWRGCWSRRLTDEHRVVYRVTEDAIDFLQARYHYD